MPAPLQIRVADRQQTVFDQDFTGSVELGRQSDAQEELYSAKLLATGRWRAVIARLDEDTLSRRHALLEPLEDGRVRVTNVSSKVPIRVEGEPASSPGREVVLPAGGAREVSLPATLVIGGKAVRLQGRDRPQPFPSLRGLPASTPPPGQPSLAAARFHTILVPEKLDMRALLGWLKTTMDVLQSAATSSDFFDKAAQAVVDIVGCDTGRVLLLEGGEWRPAVVRAGPGVRVDPAWKPSRSVLTRLRQERRTFWQGVDQPDGPPAESLMGVELVVAAPILDRAGEVIGAVYGDCHELAPGLGRPRVTDVEAMLVELLASGVATGLARIEQEKAAIEADIRFGQFFTRELSRQLALQPDLLNGRDSEVSILFCDIRGFSRVSERLGPGGTVEWVGDVMGALSDCVLAHRGVLVDYIGDELMAMWGAPEEQPDHARLACRAALDMLARLPALNERWQATLGEPLSVGIGINTGKARVGNTGSRHKFKYGPLGHPVNLASRVQGATKYLRTRLLVTEFTRAQLDADFEVRRLCKVHVVNIAGAVDLYELAPDDAPAWPDVKARYEEALAEFEQGNFRSATRLLGNLLAQYPDDGPALVLLARAVNHLVADPSHFDPVWDLPGK